MLILFCSYTQSVYKSISSRTSGIACLGILKEIVSVFQLKGKACSFKPSPDRTQFKYNFTVAIYYED